MKNKEKNSIFTLTVKNQNPRMENLEFLRIQRMDGPEIEDLALDGGIRGGFLIDLKSDERLERWKIFGEER